MAVVDPAKTVEGDVRKLRTAPELQPTIKNVKIGGYISTSDPARSRP
jgi:carbonic anhydrase